MLRTSGPLLCDVRKLELDEEEGKSEVMNFSISIPTRSLCHSFWQRTGCEHRDFLSRVWRNGKKTWQKVPCLWVAHKIGSQTFQLFYWPCLWLIWFGNLAVDTGDWRWGANEFTVRWLSKVVNLLSKFNICRDTFLSLLLSSLLVVRVISNLSCRFGWGGEVEDDCYYTRWS